jgi:hypothetical protein
VFGARALFRLGAAGVAASPTLIHSPDGCVLLTRPTSRSSNLGVATWMSLSKNAPSSSGRWPRGPTPFTKIRILKLADHYDRRLRPPSKIVRQPTGAADANAKIPEDQKPQAASTRQAGEATKSRLEIINSSIVIWALTALVGSFVTFTYTNLQSCLKDADEKATRANSIYAEVLDRRVDILHAINDAKNLPDLSPRLKNLSYIRYDFKDVPLLSLAAEMRQFQTITHKLPFAEELGRTSIEASRLSVSRLSQEAGFAETRKRSERTVWPPRARRSRSFPARSFGKA